MSDYAALFKPFQLKSLTLRNRIYSTSHAPAFAEDGAPKERYQLYHLEKARGGVGLTMFGGSSSVSLDSPLTFSQISVATDDIIPYLQQFSDRIHAEGAKIMVQISHMGMRAHWDLDPWLPLINPSTSREPMHRSWSKAMEDFDFERVRDDYAAAARRAMLGGLDGLEIAANAHHLFDSFLTPLLNRRTDRYGGSTEARLRFPLEILGAAREAVGPDFVLGVRLTGDDLVKGGLDAHEALDVAVALSESGLIDFLNVFQGNGDYGSHLREMIPDMDFDSAPFLYLASAIKAQVNIPIFHATGIRDLATASRAVEGGHVDLVGMTRAQIADPHMIAKVLAGREDDVRQCIGANYCIDRVSFGKPMACVQNASTGREGTLPHRTPKSARKRRVTIVGGGPAGLEAARSAREAGHEVMLFEASDKLGGQLNMTTAVGWRSNMGGILRWLEGQVRKLGVDVKTGIRADVETVKASVADVVLIATGGKPAALNIDGAQHIHSSWDILSGKVLPGANMLVFDETGQHQAMNLADFASERGSLVEVVTPDQMIGEEVGGTARKSYLMRLYKRNVIMTASHHLTKVYTEGNSLIAVLREHYSGFEFEREVTQVVYECGTVPNDDLYFALKPLSRNLGELDMPAFLRSEPQTINNNPDGAFQLFRIGDAIMSRNIHASIFDGARIARGL